MRCLNCGRISDQYLCDDCLTADILDKVFNQIRFYKPETCENPYLAEYAAGFTEKYAERDIIPAILDLFDKKISEYYYCLYYRMRRDDRFEDAAISYLQTHSLSECQTQDVLYRLVESYIPNDFVKPQKWCAMIGERDGSCCELYVVAAKYFAMIGDYDVSDRIADKAIAYCKDPERELFLFSAPEGVIGKL